MDSEGRQPSKNGKNGSFFEFSATSIHYWTTKNLNKLTSKKKKEEPSQFASKNEVKTTTFGVEPGVSAPKTFEHREFHSYEREDKVRRPSTTVSDHYATVGRQGRPTYTSSYYPRSNSMDRKRLYSAQDVFKSESKLDYDNLPSTSSRTWLPGEPITMYEERYESSSEVETWIQTQSIGTRLLDKHDRLILKNKDQMPSYQSPVSRNGVPSPATTLQGGYISDYSSDYYHVDPVEHECLEHYENNLERYKDERDAIQKKTFTKWVNKHLSKSNRKVEDLYVDLRDGFNLIALLEALSGETLPRENGYTRFHRIQNVQYVLEFLKKKNIKVVNIRPEDIVEGNAKLTLGLIWTIILNFQVSVIKIRQKQEALAKLAQTSSHYNDAAVVIEQSSSSYYHSTNGATSSTSASRSVVERETSKSYSKKASHKREVTGGASGGSDYHHIQGNGGPFVTSPPPSVKNGSVRNEGAYGQRSSSMNRGEGRGEYSESHYVRGAGGQMVPIHGDRHYEAGIYGGQAFSESSAYETHEHYEKKMKKKTRGERDRRANGFSNGSLKKVSEVLAANDGITAKEALLQWARKVTQGYPGVNVTNFTNSWRDGLAFNAILHRYRPNLINWNKISDPNVPPRDRLRNAFDTADSAFGVSKLLDPEDVDVPNPDEKSVITYVSSLYNALPHLDELSKYEQAAKDYENAAAEWLAWTKGVTELMHDKESPHDSATVRKLMDELQRFKSEDLPPMEEEKYRLFDLYNELQEAFKGTEFWKVPEELKPDKLEEAWQELLKSMDFRWDILKEEAGLQDLDSSNFQGNIDDIISRLTRGIGIVNEKLDLILKRIEDIEARADSMDQSEVKRIVQEIVDDLGALEQPINDLFDDVDILKSQNHPRANEFYRQVYGLHQRRMAYLDRLGKGLLYKLGMYTDSLHRQRAERTKTVFESLEEAIRWVRERLDRLNNMVFHEDLEALEELFEQHKIDNRDIQDFHQTVKECIARQAEVSAEDSHEYCELLRILESEYQQLRDLSAGRMLDLDSLIAFIRAAQLELIWIHEREDIEVSRNWSDINQLDLPMLQNYYKQLLHEIELREKQFNDVHNQGAALINQRHPANEVIEIYLRSLQNQWDWLLGLTKCLEGHLRDALNLKSFQEEVAVIEEWIKSQTEYLENNYNRTDFTVEEGERWLRELNEIREIIQKYHHLLMSLAERSAHISPLWQRGERIRQPMNVTAWCDYKGKDIEIRQGEDCTLLDNSDLLSWTVRGVDGATAQVPSVIFRIPPPDPQLTNLLARLAAQLDKMRKLWDKKHRMIRYNMMMSTMKSIQGWDLDTFLSYPPEQRDEIIKALNDDVNKLLSEMDPNDPLALRLKEELKRTNDHFLDLLNQSLRGPDPDLSNQFDKAIAELLKKLEEAWKKLNERTAEPVPKTLDELERLVSDHRAFEDALQALDTDVSNVKELFRQLPNPTPTQRANHDYLNSRWEDLWELSRMYVERLKLLQQVLQGIAEVTDIVRRHEISLSSFDDMPAALDKLRGVHSQLLELNMVLQQQENIIHSLNQNAAKLRQHVARTRLNIANHPDVDKLEDEVSRLTVRWDNVCSQVAERLKVAEEAQHTQMVYRSQYDEEIQWLDRVENTINSLRRPEQLRPEELQGQLDLLMAEYSQLQEHTATIEDINKQGGKFIRDAKNYDNSLDVFRENITTVHGPGIRSEFRRTQPQPKNGAQIVTEELEALNRRFAQLSSVILERRNQLNVLIQNWKRKQQEEEERRRAEEEAKRRAFEAARLKALEEADRLRREREAAEAARRAAEEADRIRREREAAEAARRAAEEAERRRREEEERRRREAEERERRRLEALKPKEPKLNIAQPIQQAFSAEDYDTFDTLRDTSDVAKIAEHEDEMQMYQEETVTKTQFYEMEGILHKQTGEILTFVEAIRQGLLDLSSSGGQFFDLVSGSKISLEKAAELGYINADVNALLNTRHGIRHPDTGEELTLLEAIQIGLYDPDSRQLRDIHTGEILGMLESKNICDMNTQRKLIKQGVLKLPPISLENAIQQGVINTESGQFTGKFSGEVMSIQDALYNEYIQLSGQTNPTMAATLSDAIEDGLIDSYSGEFVDKNSGEKFTLRQALSGQNKLISERSREIVNTQTNQRVTVQEAILKNAINLRQGNFTDLATRNSLNLRQAFDSGYIAKPMTLTEAVHKDAVDSANRFTDKGTKNRYTLLEAIANGVIDPDVRHIVDPDEKEVISIAEALERGLIDAQARINLQKEQRTVDLREAVREGLLSKRVHHTIFEVKGFKNTKTGLNLNFNEAVEAGILNVPSERVVDLNTNQSSSISDSRVVDPLVKSFLTEPCGIKDGSYELTLIRAVAKGIVDPVKGVIIHHNHEVTPREAYNSGVITLRGALKLAALLDVHPSLMTPIKRHDRKKRIQRPGQAGGIADDQIKVTLAEAMKQGLIDSRSQRFRQGNTEMSLHDAISQGLIDPTSEWVIPNRNSQVGPTIEEKTQETVTETGQQLAPKIYPDKQYEENVSTVKRVKRTETSAVGGPGGVSVYRAITGGKGSIEVPAEGYHIREAERRGIVDLSSGIVSPPGIDKQLTLEEAFTLGVLNPKSVSIKDPKSNRQLNALEAIEQKIIDRQGYLDYRGRRLTLQEAIEERIAHLEAEPPAHYADSNKKVIQFSQGSGPVMSFRPVGQAVIEEHEQAWSFDSSVGQLIDSTTGERLSLDAALRNGRIAQEDLRVRDALTGREMTFEEAEKWGIIDSRAGYYLDKTNNQRLPFTEAARQHRIYPTGGVPENAGDAVHTTVKIQTRSQVSKKEAVNTGAGQLGEYNITKMITANGYDSQSGRFRHPDADKEMTLKELIVKGYLNPYATTVIDKRNNREIKLLDAIEDHIVDDINGTVKDTSTGREVDFRTAINQGLVKEQTHDSIEGFLSTAGASVPGSSHSPRLVERKLQLTPYSQEPGSHRPQESHVSNFVKNQIGLIERRGAGGDVERLVDLGAGNQVMVKVIKGDDGIEKGEYVDPNTGMKFTIQLHGDPYVTQTTTKVKSTSQVQSIDLEPHAQFVGIDKVKDMRTGRVMSLQDAQRMGLARVDKKGKQATKSYSVFRSNIQLAVNSGIVDSRGEKISLEEAIRSRVVDIQNLKYIHPKTNEPLDLSRAANMGLIDVTLAETLPKGVCHPANGEKISIQKAIELGIVNPRSGEVRNPFTNEKLTWVDLVKPVYASLTMEGIYDPKKGYGVPIAHAFNEGLIDTKTEQYSNSITGDRFSLADATSKGLIDQETHRIITTPFLQDYRTRRQLNLIQAVGSGLVDPRARTVKLNDNKIISISQAVKEGAIPRDIGDRLRKADRLTFAEALGIGAVDVVADTFTDPDTGKQMSIAQAVQAGLLDTGDVESIDEDNRNLAKVLNSDEFDERSGRVRDGRSGMHLTFRAAVDQGVIDPDSLLHDIESSQTMTIREALNKNVVDGDGKYVDPKTHNKIGLSEANRLGLVALIASPMQAAQAVTEAVKRREAEGYKFKIESLDDGSHGGRPKFRDEQTIVKLTPRAQQPGLAAKFRSNVSESPRTSRRSMVDDAIALADLQNEFLDRLQQAGVNIDEPVLQNPSTMRNVSLREAVESGLLDVVNNEIVHPTSGRHYTLPKAAHMRLMNPESAEKLLKSLNLPTDELNQLLHPSTSTPVATSYHYSSSTANYPEVSYPSGSSVHEEHPSGDRKSLAREINWSGDAAELRRPGGDVKVHTFTSPDGSESFQEKCSDQTVFLTRILQELQQLPNVRSVDLDFGTPDSTSAARIELLKIRENLAQYGGDIERALREADRLCDEGAEVLSPDQFHALKESRQKLYNQYKSLVDYTDTLLKRLDVATSLLIEFTKKSTEFQTWIYSKSKSIDLIRQRSGDPSRLNDAKREAKILHDEILGNDDALREISQLASRIEVEVRSYIEELKKQDPNAKHPPLHAEEVQNTVQVIQNNYETLIKDSNLLAQFLNKLRSLSIDYDHHKNEVNQWLSGLERQVRDNDPTASKEPPEVQLDNLLLLSQTAIANQPKIEAAEKASKEFLDATVATDAHGDLSQQQKMELDDIERRFNLLDKKIKDNVDFVRSEIANKDGVLQGLDNLRRWLDEAEADSMTAKGLPLILDRLKEFKYRDQLKESEVNSQEKVLNDLGKQLEKMKTINPNIVAENSLEEKFDDTNTRFTKLRRNRRGFSENLHDIIGLLETLQGDADNLNRKLVRFNEDIDKTEPTDKVGMKGLEDELNNLIDQDWSDLSMLARKILGIPGIEEEQHLHDIMTGLEKALKRTQNRLTDKHNAGDRLTTDKVQFNQKLQEVNDLLDELEDELRHQILDISIDDNALQEQRDICKDIDERLKDSRAKVDEVEQLGTDLIQASGIVQKRKSMDLEANDGIGKVARQLFDVRSRQDDAERALHNLELRINENDEKRQGFEARQQAFIQWLENENNLLQERQKMELDEVSLKTTSKDIKGADKRWRDKQPELGELRAMANQLCNLAAFDSRQEEIELIQNSQKKLDSEFEKLDKENTELEIAVATGIVLLNDGNSIEKWINSKKKVLDICNVNSDSKAANYNLTLLEVLSGDLEDEKSKWNKFNETAEELKKLSRADSFREQVQDKVEEINNKWKDLEDSLKAKMGLLNRAKSLGGKFDEVEKEIKKSLADIELSIDEGAKKQLDSPESIKSYISMLDSLQDRSTPKKLSELESIGSEIEQLATDPTLKSDIKNRVNNMKTASDELGKKLESLKKAAIDSQNKGNEILSEYDDAMDWIAGAKTTLDHLPGVSADQGKLNDQMDKFEDLYKEALEREGPMMLLKAKLADASNKSSNPEELQKKLQNLNSEWDPLLSSIKDRNQKMESVKKLLDELGDVEVEVKNGLTEVENQIENAKQAEKDGEVPDLKPTEDLLKEIRPKIDGILNLVKKIESVAPGADAKKLNRDAENLLSDFDRLSKEYENQSKLAQTRNELRNQFEKAVVSSQKLLEGIRVSSGINDGQIKLSKEKLKLLLEDLENNWSKHRREVQNAADKLKPLVDSSENEEIEDTLVDLDRSYKELSNQLGLALDEMNEVEGVIGQSSEKGRALKEEVEDLADRISDLSPIGRDSDVLKGQDRECDELNDEINEKEKSLELLAIEWKKHLEEGKVVPSQLLGPQKEMDHCKHKLEQQKKKLGNRKKQIKDVNDVIDKLNADSEKIMGDLDSLASDEIFTQPIATELPELRRQQNGLKQLKSNDVKPVTDAADDLISTTKELIRSAEPGVPTKDLEELLKDMTNKMNELNSAIDERERKIEAAVQGLGSYNDAYKALLNWIEEIEELVANQKPPSADYKVTRAQLQNHDFQMKLIEDKKPSVDGFLAMIDRVCALAQDEESKRSISAKAEDISMRYNALVDSAKHRRLHLFEAANLGEEFSSIVKPLSQWLESAAKEVQALTSIPTNKDKLNEQIRAQEVLLDVIDSKRGDFDRLYEIYVELSKLVGPEDAIELESTFHNLTEKYNDVGMRCKSLGNSLHEMKKGITSFLEDADHLSHWLDTTEAEIKQFGDMSIYPEELIAQSEVLATLVNAVTEQQELVSRVVQDSNELCSHTSGSEAMALQYRIENLRHRYSQISNETEQKISAITEAIPLSEEIVAGFKDVNNFIDDCEAELEQIDQMPLEEQTNIINQIESEMTPMRQDLDSLNEKSMQLQHLSSKAKADELAKWTNDINRQFNSLHDKVIRKADALNLAEKNSRKVFDDLDYSIDWFQEAHEKILTSDKPAIDTDRLKTQLKNQRLMNDDIATERASLREIIAAASKVARELKSTLSGQELILSNKIETAKKLAEDTAELGRDRLAELEQAYALCSELDDSYTEISDWLDQKDVELRSCEPINTGMSPEQLMEHKRHNDVILQAYRDQRPIIMKFERNVTTLAELCSSDDAHNLREIATATVERFREQEEEFRQRGRILDETIEQSNGFGDRLNTFLSNLESANNKIRNPEPVSTRPPLIKRQLTDNAELINLFNQKEDAFRSMKNDANAILAQSIPGDPAAAEVAQKINALDSLWFEIQDGLDRRQSFLEDTLAKADRFWNELDNCQKAISSLKRNLDSIQLTAADPQKLEENKIILNNVGQGIAETTPAIKSLRNAGENLAANVADDEKHHVEHQLMGVENDWATVTAIYAQMSNNLIDAMSRSMNFHELLRQLLIWLNQEEQKVASLPPLPSNNIEAIYQELGRLEEIRREIDEQSVLREQLNRAADELYANAHPSQVNAVRTPMNDLNARWNKLYSLINERQQKLERALLELGQFEQAYNQLLSWTEKTDKLLNEIPSSCRDLKQIEVELCKLKVIQNDIQSHVPSFDAIMKAGKSMITNDPESAKATQQKLDTLNDRWISLNKKAENLWKNLEVSKQEASNRDGEFDRWALWLEDLLNELSYSSPIGGLPETAQNQLDDFQIILADVEEKRPKIEGEIKKLYDQISSNPGDPENAHVQHRYDEIKKNWTRANEKLVDREKKLQIALHDAIALSDSMQEMTRWLDNAENYLSNLGLISRLPEPLEKQMDEHQLFAKNVSAQREVMSDLNTRGTKIQFTCEKKDAVPIKNRLISLKHRFDKVVNRTADRTKNYDNALGESQTYFNAYSELSNFLDRIGQTLKNEEEIANDSATGDRLRGILEENKELLDELSSKKPLYEATEKRGKSLQDHAPTVERPDIHKLNTELSNKWKKLHSDASKRQRSVEDALVQSGKFDEALEDAFKWLSSKLPPLEKEVADGQCQGDLDTLTQISNDHQELIQEVQRRKAGIEQLKSRARKILEGSETSDKEKGEIEDKMNQLKDEWDRLENACAEKERQLRDGLGNAVDLDEILQDLNMKAAEAESRLKRIATLLPDDENEVIELLDELKTFGDHVDENQKPEVEKALELGKKMQEKVHPKAEVPLKGILKGLSGRWDSISQSIADKKDKLNKHLDDLKDHEKRLDNLNEFIDTMESALEFKDAEGDPSTLGQVDNLQAEHDLFKQDLNEKQPEVDEVVKIARKTAAKSEFASEPEGTPTSPTSKTPKPLLRGNTKLKILQDKGKKSRRLQKTDQVTDRWRKLWEHTSGYEDKLKARKEYLAEMKRLEGFTFDDWRERYLQWNDTGKARISDLFRKIDTSRTGIIPRESLIKGVLDSKFPTTPLEMIKVADEFDKGDGMISAKEFMNALRYDPKKRPPLKTEAEIIHEELRKETEKCTCAHRFPITHIGTNNNNVQYGFGFGGTMKRMVRILRSTVMVRVGGGWEKLDEFLVKHDPCRAVGRTNVHLYDIPDNALDQMHIFKSRRSGFHSGNSSASGSREVLSYVGAPGPIYKIREKTERSVPIFKKTTTPKTSVSGHHPIGSYSTRRSSDYTYGDSKIPRPSPSVSRSSSRQNISSMGTPVTSRPPSRMSDDSEERPPSRIPSIRGAKGVRYQPPGQK